MKERFKVKLGKLVRKPGRSKYHYLTGQPATIEDQAFQMIFRQVFELHLKMDDLVRTEEESRHTGRENIPEDYVRSFINKFCSAKNTHREPGTFLFQKEPDYPDNVRIANKLHDGVRLEAGEGEFIRKHAEKALALRHWQLRRDLVRAAVGAMVPLGQEVQIQHVRHLSQFMRRWNLHRHNMRRAEPLSGRKVIESVLEFRERPLSDEVARMFRLRPRRSS